MRSAPAGYVVLGSGWQGRSASSPSSSAITRVRLITEKREAMPEVLDHLYHRYG
ncbi:MAG: hypothetical protein M3265_01590 [Actinomycetota bacterium]|nr:hypothetical protein [Actinomycetota bacterium]